MILKSYADPPTPKAAKLALKLANEPNRFLSTIQIRILTDIYSGAALTDDFSLILNNWGVSAVYSPHHCPRSNRCSCHLLHINIR